MQRIGRRQGILSLCVALAAGVHALPAQAQQAWLVWTAGGKGIGTTQLVEGGTSGPKVTASGAGLVVAVPGRVWAVREAQVAVPVLKCACLTPEQRERLDPDRPPAKCVTKAKYKTLHLVDAHTGKATLVARAPLLLTDGEGSPRWSTELLGQVGPYVLAADYSWEMPCAAAHGGGSASFVALDLVSGKSTELWAKGEQAQLARAGSAKALTALSAAMRKDGMDGKIEAEMANTLAVQALSPTWDAPGKLAPRYLYVLGWDFASGDGVWGSYSRSAWVQIPHTIKRFQDQPLLPLAVRQQFALLPQARRFGWSAVESSQLELVRRELTTPTPVAPAKVTPSPAGGAKPVAPKATRPGGRAGTDARASPGGRAVPVNTGRAPR